MRKEKVEQFRYGFLGSTQIYHTSDAKTQQQNARRNDEPKWPNLCFGLSIITNCLVLA